MTEYPREATPDGWAALRSEKDDMRAAARIECDQHHWVSTHQPGLPVFWVDQCSLCGDFNAERMAEEIAASESVVRLTAALDRVRALIDEVYGHHGPVDAFITRLRAALDGPSEPDVTREVATLAVVLVLDTYDETPLPRKSNVERGERVVNALIAAGLLRAALDGPGE